MKPLRCIALVLLHLFLLRDLRPPPIKSFIYLPPPSRSNLPPSITLANQGVIVSFSPPRPTVPFQPITKKVCDWLFRSKAKPMRGRPFRLCRAIIVDADWLERPRGKWLRIPRQSLWPRWRPRYRACPLARTSQTCEKLRSSCCSSRGSLGSGACFTAANGERSRSDGAVLDLGLGGLAWLMQFAWCSRSAELAFSLPALPLSELQPPPPLTEVRTSLQWRSLATEGCGPRGPQHPVTGGESAARWK